MTVLPLRHFIKNIFETMQGLRFSTCTHETTEDKKKLSSDEMSEI